MLGADGMAWDSEVGPDVGSSLVRAPAVGELVNDAKAVSAVRIVVGDGDLGVAAVVDDLDAQAIGRA